ncbi:MULTISPECIES: hypothetical protein [Streptomyces]|uniref:hypothetical protein n=1 Tax=Streptomyces TaxID=1883 RepID=UPI001FE5B7F9|nr:hypothetical protein [Streptomyces glaucescens]
MTALNDGVGGADGTGGADGVGRQPLDADRVKHLEFIQATIARLGTNSFLVKGWALTLGAGFLALSAGQKSGTVAGAGVVPLLCFWFLDAHFLRQERLYRRLYDAARRPDSTVEVLSMDVRPFRPDAPLYRAVLSDSLGLFYGALVLTELALVIVLS